MAAPLFCRLTFYREYNTLYTRRLGELCYSNVAVNNRVSRKRCICLLNSERTIYQSKSCLYSSESASRLKCDHLPERVTHEITNDRSGTLRQIVEFRKSVRSGPSFNHFLANNNSTNRQIHAFDEEKSSLQGVRSHPYLLDSEICGNKRKVYFDVYGCQMNVNDTEIAWSILNKAGFLRTEDISKADVILIMTCSIREGAEKKIWNQINFLKGYQRQRSKSKNSIPVKIGILGCMAERLKSRILDEEKAVDLVAGPDSYKDLPAMLSVLEDGNAAVNVILSMDETYADVMPIRLSSSSPSAFVSIMRGCDNMCSYCIVPFTRGRERSRPISSITEEIRILSDQGVKEAVLLGQNVNSYRDLSEMNYSMNSEPTKLADGFKTIYKSKVGGRRFADLLEAISEIDPEMRIRFTSPHPKDFPDEVLHLIKDKHNICNQLHMPAQSGNDEVLSAMRRGYTRHAYLDLVHKVQSILPGVTLSSDFICGFCGESEEAHQDTLSLIKQVRYNTAYIFPYSLREKTHAHRKLTDDVSTDVKKKRAAEAVVVYREEALKLNKSKIDQEQLVLIEGRSKRSLDYFAGRNDGNVKVIVADVEINDQNNLNYGRMVPGDYVAVKITDASSQVLKGIPLYRTTLKSYSKNATSSL